MCVCVCFSYDSANLIYTVHLELNVTILTQAMIFLNQCDVVTETGCVYFRVETKFYTGLSIIWGSHNDLYSSPNIVRVMRWVGHVARMGEERGVYTVLVGKPEGRRPLGRPRRRRADNIRTDLQEVGCEYMDWIGLAQDKDRWRMLVSAVMNLRVP